MVFVVVGGITKMVLCLDFGSLFHQFGAWSRASCNSLSDITQVGMSKLKFSVINFLQVFFRVVSSNSLSKMTLPLFM